MVEREQIKVGRLYELQRNRTYFHKVVVTEFTKDFVHFRYYGSRQTGGYTIWMFCNHATPLNEFQDLEDLIEEAE